MVAVAETVHERPEPWRPPRASYVAFGALTIVAIVALVAIVVPLVSGSRVTPRNAPADVFEAPTYSGVRPFDAYVGNDKAEPKVKAKAAKVAEAKVDQAIKKVDGGAHGSVEVNVDQHVAQSSAPTGGTATNVHASTNSSSSGDSVSTSNNSSSASHSVVVSNNGSTQVSKSGTTKNSVNVDTSSRVNHRSGAADDDWGDNDWGDDDWDDDWDD